jgi:isoleucyl-tRNA synthetase
LLQEGAAREVTRRIQQFRKDSGLEVSDRIRLILRSTSQELVEAFRSHSDGISSEVLASSIQILLESGSGQCEDINGKSVFLEVVKES